jgi:XTP/dITP diphosphohydrolase
LTKKNKKAIFSTMEIVMATRNRKKVEEISRIFEEQGGCKDGRIVFLTLADFPSCPEVEEDADTFEGNAVKKALATARYTGRAAVADDSGLEVYVLNNAPGVLSARYAGTEADDRANNEKLLGAMENIPDARRGGRFVCCIAFALPNGTVRTFTGFSEGTIALELRGSSGFGYDPLFYPKGNLKTFAEMLPREKDALSHRKKALEQFKDFLEALV